MVPQFGFIFFAIAFGGKVRGLQEAGKLHERGQLFILVVEFYELIKHDRGKES